MLWLGDRLTPARVAGLAIGFAGVVWLVVDKSGLHPGGTPLGGRRLPRRELLYGLSASLTKRRPSGVPPMAVAAGSQLVGAVVLAVPAALAWPAATPG